MTRPLLLDLVAAHGFATFERGDVNLNIVGLRSRCRESNRFNDRICVAYKDAGSWITRTFAATTDPGVYWREHPMNVKGTAILKPGQYRGAYRLGLHRRQYRALVQTGGPVQVWRDDNRDEVLDMDPATDVDDGFFGINIHRASSRKVIGREPTVGRFSAGCQVFRDPGDFDTFVGLCERSAVLYGEAFTYTLIDESD